MAFASVSRKLRTDIAIGIVVGLVAVGLVRQRPAQPEPASEDLLLAPARAMDRLESTLFDRRVRAAGADPRATSKLLIIDFDEAALVRTRETLGAWPWPRSAIAGLVAESRALGARLIVLDDSFSERDGHGREHDRALSEALEPPVALGFEWSQHTDGLRPTEGRWAFPWQTFASREEALRAVAPIVAEGLRPYLTSENGQVSVWVGGYRDEAAAISDARRIRTTTSSVRAPRPLEAAERQEPVTGDLLFAEQASIDVTGGTEGEFRSRSRVLLPPTAALLPRASHFGFSGVVADHDGVARGLTHLARHEGRWYPSLPLRAVTELEGSRSVRLENHHLLVGNAAVPYSDTGWTLLRYRDPDPMTGGYPVLSAEALFRSAERRAQGREADPRILDQVADAIVIFGRPADVRAGVIPSSMGRGTPHAVFVAAAIDNLLSHRGVVRASVDFDSVIAFAFALLGGLVSTVCMRTTSLRRTALLELIIGAGVLVASGWAVSRALDTGLWVGAAIPLGAFLAVVGIANGVAWLDERDTHSRLREAMGRSSSGWLLHRVMRFPARYSIDGTRRDVALCTVEMNTARANRISDPAELVAQLRLIATTTAELGTRYGAYFDAPTAGAATLIWGLPISGRLEARKVCEAGLAIRDRLASRAFGDREPGWIAMGMELGPAVVGEVGPQGRHARASYTAVGEARDTAKRVLAIAHWLQVELLVGPGCRMALERGFEFRKLGRFRAEPGAEPLEAFEVLGAEGVPSSEVLQRRQEYEQALALMESGDMRRALPILESLLERAPRDLATSLHLALARAHADNGSPWDGLCEWRFGPERS